MSLHHQTEPVGGQTFTHPVKWKGILRAAILVWNFSVDWPHEVNSAFLGWGYSLRMDFHSVAEHILWHGQGPNLVQPAVCICS